MIRTVWARRDQPSTLVCGLEPREGESVEWRRDGQLIFNAFANETGHTAPNLQGRIVRAKGVGLTIHAVQVEDQATYQCTLTAFQGALKTNTRRGGLVRLVVRSPPRISRPLDQAEQFARAGQTLRIHCLAQGVPPPDIIWTKGGRVVSSSSLLHIEQLNNEDQGKYMCHASNVEGSARATLLLHFTQSPLVDADLLNKTVVEGANVFWHCAASAAPPNLTYRWTKDGDPVSAIELGLRAHIQDGDFGISRVRREDCGWFECSVSNGFPPSASTKAYLNVQYRPEVMPDEKNMYVMAEGADGTVTCRMDANPPARERLWSRNGVLLVAGTSQRMHMEEDRLLIRNASIEDSGMYACWAQNVVGKSAVHEVHVIVATPPEFSKEPPSEVLLQKGENLTIQCDGYGDPPPTQYWLHNTDKITNKTLDIKSAGHADHGLYQCVLVNQVTSVVRNMTVTVNDTKPQCVKSFQLNCLGETGFRVDFEPGYDGGHQQQFMLMYRELPSDEEAGHGKWVGSNKFRDTSLALTDLKPFTKYRVMVSVSNELGFVNCSGLDKYTCSELDPPSDLRASNEYLEWSPVPYASSYLVSYQNEPQGPYRAMGQASSTRMSIDEEKLNTEHSTNFRVQALRPPYNPSRPSDVLTFKQLMPPNAAYTHSSIIILSVCMFAFIMYVFGMRYCKKKKSSSVRSTADQQYLYKPSTPLQADHECLYSARTDHDIMEVEFDADGNQVDVLRSSPDGVINDMLRHKYIFNNGNSNLGRIREELHIERLREELRQSEL